LMATARQQPQQQTEPDEEPTLGTLNGIFEKPLIVDEVHEVPLQAPQGAVGYIIRPNITIEQMTIGEDSFDFKAGTRYRVPERVAQILFDRDLLMEMPFRG